MSTLYEIIYFAVNITVSLLEDLPVLTFLNVLMTGPVIYRMVSLLMLCIDFSEAFDIIQHDKLFVKLRSHGTDGILLQWIINLFTNWLFCTRIDDLLSSFVTLISGVIQGSVIGPHP